MKTNFLLLFPALPFLTALGLAQAETERQLPPPVVQALPLPATGAAARPENQRLYGPTSDTLIAHDAANDIVEKFRRVYASANAPRLVIYVNRELVDLTSGLKLTGRKERFRETTKTEKGETASTATKTTGTNTYAVKDATAPTLADKQTVREIERLVGRAFRAGGAKLADQKTAASLLEEKDKAGGRLTGDQAAKDRAALTDIADIAIEVLISSRNLTVAEVSGDKTYPVPDIQATAIRLKDSAIIGQASASDVLGKDAQAGRIVKQFDVRDITEATALALMEDMLTGAK